MVQDRPVADSVDNSWVDLAPEAIRPYLRLARLDRPAGVWLLFIPVVMGLALDRLTSGPQWGDVWLLILFFVGAVAMRGAGCTFNDLMDRDIDAQVARTADRPLAAGTVTPGQAWIFLVLQLVVGLIVLILIPRAAQVMALLAVPLAVAYPFMKRLIAWPQAWLGATFAWGALVGYAATHGGITLAAIILWLALALWTFGYDTLYALEDRADDEELEIGSAVIALGDRWRGAVAIAFFLAGFLIWMAVLREGLAADAFAQDSPLRRTIQAASFGGIAFVIATLWSLWEVDEHVPGQPLRAFRRQVPIGGVLAAFLLACPLVT